MKIFTLFAAFVGLLFGKVQAQTVQWAQLQDVCPPTLYYGVSDHRIATDGLDLVSVGTIAGAISFGSQTFSGNEYNNGYLAKHSPSGALLWARHLVGATELVTTTDGVKNIFVFGRYTDSLYINNLIYGPAGNSTRYFIAKFSAQGALLWVRNVSSGYQTPNYYGERAITIDGTGNVYAASVYSGTFTAGPVSFNGQGGQDIFLVKYDTNGTLQWAKDAGTPLADRFPALTGGLTNNIYVVSVAVTNSNPTFGANNYYLRKLDANGIEQWQKSGAGINTYHPVYLTRDVAENVYMAGHITTPVQFGNQVVNIPSGKNSDAYLAKISPSGNWVWAKQLIGSQSGMLSGMESQTKNEINITKERYTSSLVYDFIFEKLDTMGNPVQVVTLLNAAIPPSTSTYNILDFERSLTNDAGDIYFSGRSGNSNTLGNITLNAPPPSGIMSPEPSATFIAKLQGSPTGLKELKNAPSLKIYPNPAAGYVIIESELKMKNSGTVTLVNMLGQTVANITLPATSQIHFKMPLNNLPKGVYVVQLETDTGRQTQHLVIQ